MAKIPNTARRVFAGILFDVYQWDQELFDGTTATFEAVRRSPSVQIVATTARQEIILLQEEQPHVGSFISVPGGRVERGHTPEETVEKELLEELGMRAENLVLWEKNAFGSTIQWESYNFVARNCRQVQEPQLEPGERIGRYLVSFEEFLEQVERPDFRNKSLADKLFRLRHSEGGLDDFRRLLFG